VSVTAFVSKRLSTKTISDLDILHDASSSTLFRSRRTKGHNESLWSQQENAFVFPQKKLTMKFRKLEAVHCR